MDKRLGWYDILLLHMSASRYLLTLSFGLIVALPVFAVFDRNLQVGSEGGDVAFLQRVLNSDPLTIVTVSGAGSVGQETIMFGNLTKQAVVRFQNKYRSEILVPAGLSEGTGFVGPATRVVLERLYGGLTGIAAPLVMTVDSNFSVPPPPPPIDPSIANPSPSSSNRTPILSSTEHALSSDLVKALKEAGISEKEYKERNAPPSSYLKIDSISPASGGIGTKVTIIGSGFATSTGQDIYVGSEIFKKVKSKDGKTLSVTVQNPFPEDAKDFSSPNKKEIKLPISIWVRDGSGISNPVFFTLVL